MKSAKRIYFFAPNSSLLPGVCADSARFEVAALDAQTARGEVNLRLAPERSQSCGWQEVAHRPDFVLAGYGSAQRNTSSIRVDSKQGYPKIAFPQASWRATLGGDFPSVLYIGSNWTRVRVSLEMVCLN